MVCVSRADGTCFAANTENVAVERNLYTLYERDGSRNVEIERWFSAAIETPFSQTLPALIEAEVLREPFDGDPRKANTVRELGFAVTPYREFSMIRKRHRRVLCDYIAALLVRTPRYLAKLDTFHSRENASDATESRNLSLANMLSLYELYRETIGNSSLMLLLADGNDEFLYADSGVTAQEPWGPDYLPFSIHAPLTPRLAVEVMPVRGWSQTSKCFVARAEDAATARMNRITLSSAERFVFSRSIPSSDFVRRYFGLPAPASIGHRWVDGRLETMHDKNRDD
jgi:hypothetical protein